MIANDPSVVVNNPTNQTKAPVRRLGRRNADTLGLAWLHGTLHATVFHRQTAAKSWMTPTPVRTLEEFESALDQALQDLGFCGSEVFLVLEHESFVHQSEYAPAFSESATRAYLRGRIERYEQEREPVLWISQRTVSARQEAAFLLHLLPSGFYGRLNGFLLARRLDLTRILPLVVPLQLVLESSGTPKDQPVLVVAEAGDATTLMVSRASGELVFARTMLARWETDSDRIAVEVNRSLLYAKQQFGGVVEHIQLLGAIGDKPQADILAKCGTGKQLTVRPTRVVDWLQAVARLSQRHPVNLVVGYLGRKRRQQFLRRAMLAACWLGLGLGLLDAWTRSHNWKEDNVRLENLAANAEQMTAELAQLEQRNVAVTQQHELIRQAVEQRLPPVPARFLAYLGSIRPADMQFTDFSIKWDSAVQKWTFRLEGQIEGDDELAREGLAAFQKTLVRSPLKARFNDSVRSVVALSGMGSGVASAQRFSIEGGYLKTKIKEWLGTYLLVLTEVPGWPDAPVSARARRALPVVIPCVGMLLLLGWSLTVHAPRVQAQQASLQPLISLESDVATLRLAFSEQQVREVAERAAGASRLLLDSPADLPEFLRALKQEAAGRGWDAGFFAADASDIDPLEGTLVSYLPVRAKLVPVSGNPDAFASLLGLLERFSSSGKRIDLIRLAIRADERRWHLVEMNFHLACAVTNEKTP